MNQVTLTQVITFNVLAWLVHVILRDRFFLSLSRSLCTGQGYVRAYFMGDLLTRLFFFHAG